MFYLLYPRGGIALCAHVGRWVYAWHFKDGDISDGGRMNPVMLTQNLRDGSFDLRKHMDLNIPDQVDLEKEFTDWAKQWGAENPMGPSSGQISESSPDKIHKLVFRKRPKPKRSFLELR